MSLVLLQPGDYNLLTYTNFMILLSYQSLRKVHFFNLIFFCLQRFLINTHVLNLIINFPNMSGRWYSIVIFTCSIRELF